MHTFHYLLLLSAFAVFFSAVRATSEPWSPEKEAQAKVSYCQGQKDLQAKLPAKYQQYYDHIQSLCMDKAVKTSAMEQYLNENLTKDEQTEVRVIQNGKDAYCNFVLGLSELYPLDGSAPEAAASVTNSDYTQLKQDCADVNKGITTIVPLAQKLARIYYHF